MALGIGLRRCGVPVVLHESGNYPRHRVCGEFISGRGEGTLARLGLRELVEQAGCVGARTSAFFSTTSSTAPRQLPSPAICLSRFTLDDALAKKFRELGGELFEGSRLSGNFGEGVVRASGRRAQTEKSGARWFGLKIHARNIKLSADLEMHLSPQGYVGLCKINGGEVNICGLFRKSPGENSKSQNSRELLRGVEDSPLRLRLADAVFDEASFCAIAGLSLQPEKAGSREGICVGDSITMIPPVTGNGMSMAFESAGAAIAPLASWSRGEFSWEETRLKIACDCDRLFARRLAWAKWLQKLILTPALQNPLVALAGRSELIWRMAFKYTR